MSKWLHLLQECEKNKNIENQPMSVLSAAYRGILSKKNNNDFDPKIENPYFPPMSAMSASSSTYS